MQHKIPAHAREVHPPHTLHHSAGPEHLIFCLRLSLMKYLPLLGQARLVRTAAVSPCPMATCMSRAREGPPRPDRTYRYAASAGEAVPPPLATYMSRLPEGPSRAWPTQSSGVDLHPPHPGGKRFTTFDNDLRNSSAPWLLLAHAREGPSLRQ
jgi:hypothetical protein